MRIISQDKKYDLPYEQTAITNDRVYDFDVNKNIIYVYQITGIFRGEKYILGKYSSQEKVDYVLQEIRTVYLNHKKSVVSLLKDGEVVLPEEADG